ncbi:DegT/DnrJ/EryC1/StrS family aminotransferase [Litoribacter populi]|uniref:DegT/DnrJ/EryC1/StrS family aminotransferase n=1 Tax=Litoribacter populi TaxID=2598460 RepID=UPI001180E974|nr:DegT/DnrJ/EryC1/StrS family aminotransferase [Litoribacter populi]
MKICRFGMWPVLPLNVHFRKPTNYRPFPLDQENLQIYSRARHAMYNACKSLGWGKDDALLVPGYHHGSEIQALCDLDIQLKYYELTEKLEPNPEELDHLMTTNVRALYITHYLGFPQNAAFWRKWCDERNIMLIEDAAQAFLAERDGIPVGSHGDFSIYCLYKTYGLPDGGALVSKKPLKDNYATSPSGVWKMVKRHINFVSEQRGEVAGLHLGFNNAMNVYKKVKNESNEKELELGDPTTRASSMTMKLLPLLLDENTAAKRRDNYRYMLSKLGELVPPPFNELPEGASPFAFPIKMDDAKEFLARLKKKGVIGQLFWLNPHPTLPREEFPFSIELREGVMALPVHQDLSVKELDKIINAVKECLPVVQL